jgi:endonuclease YncB( thermonuclease family)
VLRVLLLAVVACALLAVPSSVASAAGKNCSDFANQAAAQAWLTAYAGDPDGLDGDADGKACEALPCPCATAGSPATPPPSSPPPVAPADPLPARPQTILKAVEAKARITSVIDGDTIKVRFPNGAKATVRLIGIDTPETKKPGTPVQCGGRAATARMKKLALRNGRGRSVTITTDPTQDLTDRHGRLLAYVSTSGADFGRAMVSSGWAKTYVYNVGFQRVSSYRAAERSARSARRGVHGRCGGGFHRTS